MSFEVMCCFSGLRLAKNHLVGPLDTAASPSRVLPPPSSSPLRQGSSPHHAPGFGSSPLKDPSCFPCLPIPLCPGVPSPSVLAKSPIPTPAVAGSGPFSGLSQTLAHSHLPISSGIWVSCGFCTWQKLATGTCPGIY